MYAQCWKSTRRRDKLLILWTLFSIQVFIIGIFVIFGSLSIASLNSANFIADESLLTRTDDFSASGGRLVKFLTTSVNYKNISKQNARLVNTSNHQILSEPIGRFETEFFLCQNTSISSLQHINLKRDLFCFRNGSVDIQREPAKDFNENPICSCVCQPHYHGKDCGQPEVVWRAFMTSHIARSIKPKALEAIKPNRLFYFVHSTIFSLTTVEIQFMELHDLIDLFILCDEIRNKTETNEVNGKYNTFDYHQTSHGQHSPFFLKQFSKKILILQTRGKCTPNAMYKLFRKTVEDNNLANGSNVWNGLNVNDVLLFSSYDEILNKQAIKYLKWYKDWTEIQPIKFRLKYTVYGFYWQHLSQTIVSSLACQLGVMDERYNGEPERMQQSSDFGMIIGDLNHYGGWFCQYCYESTIDIVHKLQAVNQLFRSDTQPKERNPNNKLVKNHPNIIDSNYIESLISAGIFVDGKSTLIRLHRFSDKYYAPHYVANKSWKYESILSNTYAHYDGGDDEE